MLATHTLTNFFNKLNIGVNVIIGDYYDFSNFRNKDENSEFVGQIDIYKLADKFTRLYKEARIAGYSTYFSFVFLSDAVFINLGGVYFTVGGVGLVNDGAIVSINSFANLSDLAISKYFKEAILHETGHIFGLMREDREQDIAYSYGQFKHCANVCSMRPFFYEPIDNIDEHPFCELCLSDLKKNLGI
ncbi:MAG: hypothetical protein Q8O88_03065 [bacterium]|nr:hypothetical protein [bacterium]